MNKFYKQLQAIHQTNFPELSFGQLLYTIINDNNISFENIADYTDDEFLNMLNRYTNNTHKCDKKCNNENSKPSDCEDCHARYGDCDYVKFHDITACQKCKRCE